MTAPISRSQKITAFVITLSAAALLLILPAALSDSLHLRFPGANQVPISRLESSSKKTASEQESTLDEVNSSRTNDETPLFKHTPESFPAEARDIFYPMDKWEITGWQHKMQSQNFDLDGDKKISDYERDAIRGRNTWMLWTSGNESFWEWYQEKAYGIHDFLALIDSRNRDHRFKDMGLINQPGMTKRDEPVQKILGLYIDGSTGDSLYTGAPEDYYTVGRTKKVLSSPTSYPRQLFTPGDQALYKDVLKHLPKDGVDANVYGYPSGIIGLRLFPNPDFFGNTEDAGKARAYWHEKVETKNDAFYTDPKVSADPKLIRPFRPGLTQAFFYVGPHPLNPPIDPENPRWENLSSTIGNQFLVPQQAFFNHLPSSNIFGQAMLAMQPGTVDKSIIANDHISNAEAINSIFEIPERELRALSNQPEQQSAANLLLPSIEEKNQNTNPRHVPRFLLNGADSTGELAWLTHSFFDLGTFSNEFNRCQTPILGTSAQHPFKISTAIANSGYYKSLQKYQIPYIAAFLGAKSAKSGRTTVTGNVKYSSLPDGATFFANGADHASVKNGTQLFLQNCAVCHSSQQPKGFEMTFSDDWKRAGDLDAKAPHLVAPTKYEDWNDFVASRPYQQYVDLVKVITHPWDTNYFSSNTFSSDIRMPITLIGTNSASAVATNAMSGQIWDNFSSDTYKNLPAVGPVKIYNPYLSMFTNATQTTATQDLYGHNDSYLPPAGGPGYLVPTPLVGVWATAPFLHTNALGQKLAGPSLTQRLAAFDDAIKKLLSKKERSKLPVRRIGDLRGDKEKYAVNDPGFIYRTTEPSVLHLPGKFIRPILETVFGKFIVHVCTIFIWLGLITVSILFAWKGGSRFACFLTLLLAALNTVLILSGHFDKIYPEIWSIPVVLLVLAGVIWALRSNEEVARIYFGSMTIAFVIAGIFANEFVSGSFGDVRIGPIPKGFPIQLITNINPEAPKGDLLNASASVVRGILKLRRNNLSGPEALASFEQECAPQLLKVSKCPDLVLDEGHWFGEDLSDQEKRDLGAFLKSL
jgi:hypothetical protein